jgi:hypothetical protein
MPSSCCNKETITISEVVKYIHRKFQWCTGEVWGWRLEVWGLGWGLGLGLGGWGFNPPKFRSFDKAEPNSQFRGKYFRNNLIRIRVSLICKLSGTPNYGGGDYCPQIPVFSALCPQLKLVNSLIPPTKFLGTPLGNS